METNPTPTSNSDNLLRADQVAERLNISRALAYHLMKTGQIPTIDLSVLCASQNPILKASSKRIKPNKLVQSRQSFLTADKLSKCSILC